MLSPAHIFAHAGCEMSYLGQYGTSLLVRFTVGETVTPFSLKEASLLVILQRDTGCLGMPSLHPWVQVIRHFFCFLSASLLSASGIHHPLALVILLTTTSTPPQALDPLLRLPHNQIDYVLAPEFIYFSNPHHLFRKQQ